MLNEINDLAGQHEVIAENLSTAVVADLTTLVKSMKDDRRKVGLQTLNPISIYWLTEVVNRHARLELTNSKNCNSQSQSNKLFLLITGSHQVNICPRPFLPGEPPPTVGRRPGLV